MLLLRCLAVVLTALLIAYSSYSQDRLTGRAFATRSEVIAERGMVCTSQPLATLAGLDVLRAGGSAVDAAIAANAVLGVVEPTGNGIGGDLFALVWDAKTEKLYGLNASGRSPGGLSLAQLRQVLAERKLRELPATGGLPVTVPGCVDGWAELHRRFGRLPLRRVLQPAIGHAREGFPVSELIAYLWGRSTPSLSRFAGFKEAFTENGRAPVTGEIFRRPDLARTLEAIATGGREAFYRGPIAARIARAVQREGGFITTADLAAHTSTWVEPVSTTYRGYTVWALPPNGQGIATLQLLNLLEGYDLKAMGYGSADYLHVFTEAKKLVFEDRARYYADPAFARLQVPELLSKGYADARRKLIRMDRAARSVEPGTLALKEGDTIYLTVADSAGNVVSLIQSNYRGMGSGVVADSCGFILQDRGENYALVDGHANVYAPNKRPFHTIIPGFVTLAGKPYLSFGVMGGEFQPLGQAQTLINHLDFGMNVQEAGDAPRIAHTGSTEPVGDVAPMRDGGEVQLESGFGHEVIAELMRRGHKVTFNLTAYGGYQAIRIDTQTTPGRRVYRGASESRKDGHAMGY